MNEILLSHAIEAERRDLLVRLERQNRRFGPVSRRQRVHRGATTLHVPVPAAAAFDAITDIAHLPEWNAEIEAVTTRPARLRPGAVWKVRMRQGRLTWISRSEVLAYDPTGLRFSYRSETDDGNPSRAYWAWTVAPAIGGCVVEVAWRLQPMTTIRRWFLAPMRARRLRLAVPVSLAALGRYAETVSSAVRQRAASSG